MARPMRIDEAQKLATLFCVSLPKVGGIEAWLSALRYKVELLVEVLTALRITLPSDEVIHRAAAVLAMRRLESYPHYFKEMQLVAQRAAEYTKKVEKAEKKDRERDRDA